MRRRGYSGFGKRLFDLILGVPALIICSPLLLLVGFGVLMDVGWPVLYVEERAGRGGKPFSLPKFRSMLDLRDSAGCLLPDAARLTWFGRFIRATSLDELPSLLNIIRGQMSLVGPRPLRSEFVRYYSPKQARRLEAVPGLTGWAAVNGRNAQSWEKIFEHDVWYVDHVSFNLDLRIIARTLFVVLRREGVDRGNCDTDSAFAAALKDRQPVLQRSKRQGNI